MRSFHLLSLESIRVPEENLVDCTSSMFLLGLFLCPYLMYRPRVKKEFLPKCRDHSHCNLAQ